MKCGQLKCENHADYRYTWPGRDEAFICEAHVEKLRQVADAMGLYLQIIPLEMAPGSHVGVIEGSAE